jgi:hypothetical protein
MKAEGDSAEVCPYDSTVSVIGRKLPVDLVEPSMRRAKVLTHTARTSIDTPEASIYRPAASTYLPQPSTCRARASCGRA